VYVYVHIKPPLEKKEGKGKNDRKEEKKDDGK
jgi:hypothetical protein